MVEQAKAALHLCTPSPNRHLVLCGSTILRPQISSIKPGGVGGTFAHSAKASSNGSAVMKDVEFLLFVRRIGVCESDIGGGRGKRDLGIYFSEEPVFVWIVGLAMPGCCSQENGMAERAQW
jgi:hypothetical protein